MEERHILWTRLSSKSVEQIMKDAFEKMPLVLYVVPSCPLCARAREWLDERGIEYVERDVAGDFGALRAMYKLTGQRLVPVFEMDGRALVRPREDELAELFNLR